MSWVHFGLLFKRKTSLAKHKSRKLKGDAHLDKTGLTKDFCKEVIWRFACRICRGLYISSNFELWR